MSGMLSAFIGSGGTVFLTSTLTATRSNNGTPGSPAGGPVSAGFQVANDGILRQDAVQSTTPTWAATSDGWMRSGGASIYDVRFTKTSGSVATLSGSATSGTWYNLATSRHVGYSDTGGGGSQTGVWTIDIALATDHATILATASATITANSNDFNP